LQPGIVLAHIDHAGNFIVVRTGALFTPTRRGRQGETSAMIKSSCGLTQEPYYRCEQAMLLQQAEAVDMIKIHAQHGSFSVIIGNPTVGKSVILRVSRTTGRVEISSG